MAQNNKTQNLRKEEMHKNEEKITNEIKENKGWKKILDEIKKLKENKPKETKGTSSIWWGWTEVVTGRGKCNS